MWIVDTVLFFVLSCLVLETLYVLSCLVLETIVSCLVLSWKNYCMSCLDLGLEGLSLGLVLVLNFLVLTTSLVIYNI